jgi:hypothetical protein
MTKLKNIKIEIINKVENNQQSKNKYKTPEPDRDIEENYERLEGNIKEPYSTPIYELMKPNINTMRNYAISNEERDRIIEEDIKTMLKPSRIPEPETEAGAEPEPLPEPAISMSKTFDMNDFKREFKNLKNGLLFKLKEINYKYKDFKRLPDVLTTFKDYILDIYKNDPDSGTLDLAISQFAEEVKAKFSDKFD